MTNNKKDREKRQDKQEIISTSNQQKKDLQQLQQVWEKTAQELKNSTNQENQMLYKILKANYINLETGLITNKNEAKQKSHSISCGKEDFKPH